MIRPRDADAAPKALRPLVLKLMLAAERDAQRQAAEYNQRYERRLEWTLEQIATAFRDAAYAAIPPEEQAQRELRRAMHKLK